MDLLVEFVGLAQVADLSVEKPPEEFREPDSSRKIDDTGTRPGREKVFFLFCTKATLLTVPTCKRKVPLGETPRGTAGRDNRI